jgi:hypothetical protein
MGSVPSPSWLPPLDVSDRRSIRPLDGSSDRSGGSIWQASLNPFFTYHQRNGDAGFWCSHSGDLAPNMARQT